MKLKYYLRGLGVGILVTASLIMSAGQKESLTDQEIRERAKALGMQESGVLASLMEENNSNPEESSSKEQVSSEVGTSSSQESTKSNGEDTSEAKTEQKEEKSSAETLANENESVQSVAASKEKEPSESEPQKDTPSSESLSTEEPSTAELQGTEIQSRIIEIVINSGDGSETVSQKMQQAGLVSSAREYNEFLCQNGYDRKLAAGAHNIPFDATYSEMAEILCKRR